MRQHPSVDDHPVLSTLQPVVEKARHVRIDSSELERVASWMAYESLPWPDLQSPLHPAGDEATVMDFIFLTSTINFAFTDFDSHRIFEVEYLGSRRYDSDAMMACLKSAFDQGVPILEGSFLKAVDRRELSRIFTGNIPIPMLEERLRIFNEVGAVLVERFGGRFHNFVKGGPQKLYGAGDGLLERLVKEFPSFQDFSEYQGKKVVFTKRGQLLMWMLHARFRKSGFFQLEDARKLTAFADYIVPLALRVLGILKYSPELENTIQSRKLIAAGSPQEVEIRALSLWAVHLLTKAVNRLRPAGLQVIEPVIDGRLWTHYHESHYPHHLTVTTAY